MNELEKAEAIFVETLQSMNERKTIQKYGESFLRYNILLTLSNVLLSVLCCVIIWYAVNPQREYFASDNGRIIKLVALSQPYQPQPAIIQFARDTLIKSFSLDFVHWQNQLESSRIDYTRSGFKSFLDSLNSSGILETIKTKRMNMMITANTGVITKQGVENGIYYSLVEVPIEVRLVGQSFELPSQKLLAIVRVERISILDSIKGIAIGQLVTKPLN